MNVEGYRQTSFKSKHLNLANERVRDFERRGEVVKLMQGGSYYYIFVKIEKELNNEATEMVEITPDEKQSGEDLGDSVDAGEEI